MGTLSTIQGNTDMTNQYTANELAANAVYSGWATASEVNEPSYWGDVMSEISGMQTLAIYAKLPQDFRDALRMLWNVALTRRSMAHYS